MTEALFRSDPYLRQCEARVTGLTDTGALIVDRSVFYPAGGGQPGDSGTVEWDGGTLTITDTVKAGDAVALVGDPAAPGPAVGDNLRMMLDWDRRHLHMRVHTALHLLSVVRPLPVTGGAIGAGKGRLDFDMPDAPEDKAAVDAALNALIARDLPVSEEWI